MQKHEREQNQQNYKQHPRSVKIYTIGMEEVVFLRVFQQNTFMKLEGSEIKSDFQKWLWASRWRSWIDIFHYYSSYITFYPIYSSILFIIYNIHPIYLSNFQKMAFGVRSKIRDQTRLPPTQNRSSQTGSIKSSSLFNIQRTMICRKSQRQSIKCVSTIWTSIKRHRKLGKTSIGKKCFLLGIVRSNHLPPYPPTPTPPKKTLAFLKK